MALSGGVQFVAVGPVRSLTAPALRRALGDWRHAGDAYPSLAKAIRMLVLDGRLPPATRLPSERTLAESLGVSRNTVTAALDILRRQGYLESRTGIGTWTTLPETAAMRPDEILAPAGELLDLTVASLPAPPVLAELAHEAAGELACHLHRLGYEPFGLPSLRAAVARHLSERGLPTAADEVLITQGALHGWNLILHALTLPGDRVLVESPTYPAALDAIAARRARAVPIPVRAGGWDMDLFHASVRSSGARLAYVIPEFQNPTGVLIDTGQRDELLAAARAHDVTLVSDEISIDLALDERARPARLAAATGGSHVVTLGSLSKSCWAGLRTGWIRADRALIARLGQTRSVGDVGGPILDGLLAESALRVYDALAADRRTLLAERCDALRAALARELPEWAVARPAGGLSLWIELPTPIASALAVAALDEGVRIAPGSRFDAAGGLEAHLRVPFALPPDLLSVAATRLAAAAARVGGVSDRSVRSGGWVL